MKKITEKITLNRFIKRIISLILFINLGFIANAQQGGFTIIALDIKNQITYDDIWNLNIITSAPHTFEEFYLKVNVYTSDNKLLLRAVTKNFNLSQGVFSVNNFNYSSILSPVTEFSIRSGYYSMLDAGGFFPAGKYVIEYDLYGISVDPVGGFVHEKVGTYALQKNIEVFFPSVLLEPANGSEFEYEETKSMFFAWTPAMVMDNNADVTYELQIYEILPGQTPEQTVNSRNTFFAERNLKNTFFAYPVYARDFTNNKSYAWHVLTYVNSNPADISEVWSFTCGSESLPDKIKACDFLKVGFTKTLQGNANCYKLLITNNYTGSFTKDKPKSFKINVNNDSIFSITGGVSNGWICVPKKIPPHTIDVKWVNEEYIPNGKTALGFVCLGNSTISPVCLTYEWLNKDEEMICKDSISITEEAPSCYYELGSEYSDNYTELSDNILNVQFFNHYASVENIIFTIIDIEAREIVLSKTERNIIINSITGLNRLSINLGDYKLLPGKTYLLTVSDFMNNYYLNFKIPERYEK